MNFLTRKRLILGLLPLGIAAAAMAQAPAPLPAQDTVPRVTIPLPPDLQGPAAQQAPPAGGTVLKLRGLDKITGRPTDITAPIGKPVRFATLTITARFCYSTPPSETPETAAFVQVEDHRPDQNVRKIFSGWMYGSSPGLNAVEHPLYDVWVISCNNAPPPVVAAVSSAAPAKVRAPDSSDKEGIQALPEEAGQ